MGIDVEDRVSVDTEREAARKRVAARRDFGSHLVVYLVINSMAVVVWAFTGHGYFWPGWLMGAWGVGVILQAWDLFWRRPVTDADVDAELARQR